MYLDFIIKKAPFHITPDPQFLFLSPSHKAALGALVYGIEERQGFVALVGEVGLGKTPSCARIWSVLTSRSSSPFIFSI